MSQREFTIQWRPAAVGDLMAIAAHIAKHSPNRAEAFAATLRHKVDRLSRHPHLGRPGRPGLPFAIRELVVHRHYIVFYRLLESDAVVEIVRVKHTSRRFP